MGTTGCHGRDPGSPENSSLVRTACPSTQIPASIKNGFKDIQKAPWLPTSLPIFTLQLHQKPWSSGPTQQSHTTKNGRSSWIYLFLMVKPLQQNQVYYQIF